MLLKPTHLLHFYTSQQLPAVAGFQMSPKAAHYTSRFPPPDPFVCSAEKQEHSIGATVILDVKRCAHWPGEAYGSLLQIAWIKGSARAGC